MNNVTEQELIEHTKVRQGRRVTQADLEANIASEHFFTAAQGDQKAVEDIAFSGGATDAAAHRQTPDALSCMTFCVLVLQNGFTVTGQAGCADPKMFDPEIGKRIAKADAVRQIWPLMGYELKCRLAHEEQLVKEKVFSETHGAETYIGTKVINAKPMNRLEYCHLRGWQVPLNESPMDEGYLVEYTDRIEKDPNVEGYLGYVSWSPKAVFEMTYRRV